MDSQSSVMIDIFSGRPNPGWELSESEALTITEMLDSLPASSEKIDPNLTRSGYRRFIVNLPDRSVEVYSGFVREKSGRGLLYFVDTDQKVERWLYALAKPHLTDDLYGQLDTMITEGGWSARVILDITAHAANPTWALSDSEIETFTAMLDALPPSETPSATARKPGYGGFVVLFPDRSVAVYGRIVQLTVDDIPLYFIDTDQRVERWLYATAKPHISDDVYQQLDTMITEGAPQ
jgi:hypothetical protein